MRATVTTSIVGRGEAFFCDECGKRVRFCGFRYRTAAAPGHEFCCQVHAVRYAERLDAEARPRFLAPGERGPA